ncbi:MAG: glucose-1-phosphate adenylyltransferase [Fibrobacter sp.]|jgi:glucose-1-phosphate adenylyltransferase|nr:glucose-1-phosphate adenylyltransferase [Fibrobacter sp.]
MPKSRVTSIILAGGQGTRLHPLTQARSKPAVPIGGKFRLIDIPISNCLHHQIRNIWVLTQFASESLHRHIFQTYRMDAFSGGFVSILAASQTVDSKGWYQGTADAVRKNMFNFSKAGDTVLLLSGDHLYRMDFERFIEFHNATGADITLAVVPVERSKVRELGIMKMDLDFRVTDFVEKPTEDLIVDEFSIPEELRLKEEFATTNREKTHVGSMGIYIFKKEVLFDLLNKYDYNDFGKQIIPAAISNYRVFAYPFDGYWEDIGTIKAFFDAHIDMTRPEPPFNFYDQDKPIFTRARFLPAAKITGSIINSSIVCEGSMIEDASISDSVIGLRSVIKAGSRLSRVIFMGSDAFETERRDGDGLGIGKNCVIQNAILDKDVRIGDNVQLINKERIINGERDGIIIRDGIIVVPKSTRIPSGFVL